MSVTDFQQKNDAVVDLTVAGLHSLANNGFVTLAEYDASAAGELNFVCDIELVLAATTPTDGNLCDLYFLMALDGTNYSDTNGPPSNLFVGSWRVSNATPLRYVLRDIVLPACKFKGYFRNGSGVATAASGSSIKLFPRRQQGTTT